MELRLPAIRGIGGAIVYLIDRYETGGNGAFKCPKVQAQLVSKIHCFSHAGLKGVQHEVYSKLHFQRGSDRTAINRFAA